MANSLLQEIQDHLLNAQKQECMINLHYCSREHIYNIKLIYLECELLPLSHNQELLLDQNLSCPCFKYFSQCAHAFCHTHTHTHNSVQNKVKARWNFPTGNPKNFWLYAQFLLLLEWQFYGYHNKDPWSTAKPGFLSMFLRVIRHLKPCCTGLRKMQPNIFKQKHKPRQQ